MMCGRSSVAHKPRFGPRRDIRTHHAGSGRFFGLDVEEMGPRAQVAAALTVLAPVALSGLFLIAVVPGLWWIFTTYFWVAFPALGLLTRGLVGLSEARPRRGTAESRERDLLEALREHGELTPARAAMETSLSVAEADQMLKDFAAGGHLEVRTRGVGLSYALWTSPAAPEGRALEAEALTSPGQKGAT